MFQSTRRTTSRSVSLLVSARVNHGFFAFFSMWLGARDVGHEYGNKRWRCLHGTVGLRKLGWRLNGHDVGTAVGDRIVLERW